MKALKELLEFMKRGKFVCEYGENLYINLKRINQDFVESFFSMTAYVYGYNINNLTSLHSSRLLMKKQTNICEIQDLTSTKIKVYVNGKQMNPFGIVVHGLLQFRFIYTHNFQQLVIITSRKDMH